MKNQHLKLNFSCQNLFSNKKKSSGVKYDLTNWMPNCL